MNCRDESGKTGLEMSKEADNENLLELLYAVQGDGSALMNAVHNNSEKAVDILLHPGDRSASGDDLHPGASLQLKDANGDTALHVACTLGYADCVHALLLADGCNVNTLGAAKKSVMQLANTSVTCPARLAINRPLRTLPRRKHSHRGILSADPACAREQVSEVSERASVPPARMRGTQSADPRPRMPSSHACL